MYNIFCEECGTKKGISEKARKNYMYTLRRESRLQRCEARLFLICKECGHRILVTNESMKKKNILKMAKGQ